LLYSSETWTIKARSARRITTAKKKYIKTAGCTWTDYNTNTQITKELNVTPILDKLLEYKRNWIQRVNRMWRGMLDCIPAYISTQNVRTHTPNVMLPYHHIDFLHF